MNVALVDRPGREGGGGNLPVHRATEAETRPSSQRRTPTPAGGGVSETATHPMDDIQQTRNDEGEEDGEGAWKG